MLARRVFLLVAAVGAGAAAGATTPAPRGLPDVLARVRRAVGAVGTYNPRSRPPQVFSASGFFINRRGYFLTANRALVAIARQRRLSDLVVFLPTDSHRRGHRAAVVSRVAAYDLALLKVEGDGFPAVPIGDPTKVRAGRPVALMGYPFGFLLGLQPSASYGIVSAVGPVAIAEVNPAVLPPSALEALRSPFNVFQLDVTAYPGHDGGPLFDPETGQVLGVVNSALIRRSQQGGPASGINYAIPIHFAAGLLDDALNAREPERPAAGGEGRGKAPPAPREPSARSPQ